MGKQRRQAKQASKWVATQDLRRHRERFGGQREMRLVAGGRRKNEKGRGAVALLVLLAGLLSPLPLLAQGRPGPITPPSHPPTPTLPHPANQPSQHPRAPKAQKPTRVSFPTYPIIHEPPSIPVAQVIQKFAAHESEFKLELNGYTYYKTVIVQTIDSKGQVDGEYKMTTDITYSPSGQRYVRVTDAPVPTLKSISLTEQDLEDFRHIQPFVLTTSQLPKYNVTYVGRQRVDYIHTYVFDVAPKKIEKHQRYFKGRIWVDIHDLAIAKTDGKAVPDIIKHNYENLFPRFTTYRENIQGQYWFPVYTYSNDILHFGIAAGGNVHVRTVIRWSHYKRFRVSVKFVGPAKPVKPHQ
jgi:hypothetical protein